MLTLKRRLVYILYSYILHSNMLEGWLFKQARKHNTCFNSLYLPASCTPTHNNDLPPQWLRPPPETLPHPQKHCPAPKHHTNNTAPRGIIRANIITPADAAQINWTLDTRSHSTNPAMFHRRFSLLSGHEKSLLSGHEKSLLSGHATPVHDLHIN